MIALTTLLMCLVNDRFADRARAINRPAPPAVESLKPDRDRAAKAAQGDLPFDEGDSIAGCGYRGTLVAPCLASEEILRPKAQALWSEASIGQRKACLDRTVDTFEPIGILFTCLAHPMPAPNLR